MSPSPLLRGWWAWTWPWVAASAAVVWHVHTNVPPPARFVDLHRAEARWDASQRPHKPLRARTRAVPVQAIQPGAGRAAAREGASPSPPAADAPPTTTLERSAAEHGAARARWLKLAFRDEPRDAGWAKRTESRLLLHVAAARTAAFAGSPEPATAVADRPRCATVRCAVTVRGDDRSQVELLARTIEQARGDDGPLWSSAQRQPPPPDLDDEHALTLELAIAGPELPASPLSAPPRP